MLHKCHSNLSLTFMHSRPLRGSSVESYPVCLACHVVCYSKFLSHQARSRWSLVGSNAAHERLFWRISRSLSLDAGVSMTSRSGSRVETRGRFFCRRLSRKVHGWWRGGRGKDPWRSVPGLLSRIIRWRVELVVNFDPRPPWALDSKKFLIHDRTVGWWSILSGGFSGGWRGRNRHSFGGWRVWRGPWR